MPPTSCARGWRSEYWTLATQGNFGSYYLRMYHGWNWRLPTLNTGFRPDDKADSWSFTCLSCRPGWCVQQSPALHVCLYTSGN